MNVKITFDNAEMAALEVALAGKNDIRFEAVRKKQIIQMYQRALSPGGTPVSTELTKPGGPHGELRMSAHAGQEEIGYKKEYGPHVEYGHRTIDGGWIPGQRFLQKNVDEQKGIYFVDLLNAVQEGD